MISDVAIVGGGPAACSAALTLRERGCSAVIIATPGHREKLTETAVPRLKQILGTLGATDALGACEPCYGIVSGWGRTAPALRPSLLDPFGHPWFIHRSRFDSCLQRAAQSAGAIWIDAAAKSVDFDLHGVSLMTTAKLIRAHWLILATGSPSWPARMTQQKPTNTDSLIGFWASLPAELEKRLLFVEPTDCGWWYLCPGDGAGAVACFVTDPLCARSLGAAQTSNWNNLFHDTKLFRQLEAQPSARFIHATPIRLASLPKKHGPRWIVTGDAAMKLDPIGSSGTTTALESGQRAAQVAVDALNGNAASADSYAQWSDGLVNEFVRQRRIHYAIETSRRPEGFWTRRA